MIRILRICFILWLGNKFLCSGTAGDSSSEDLESEDFYAAITGSSSRDTGHSSTRTLKAKAQSLLVSWLDADSKNDLSDATFLGEPPWWSSSPSTIHRSRQVPLWKDYSVSVRRFWGQEGASWVTICLSGLCSWSRTFTIWSQKSEFFVSFFWASSGMFFDIF